jgi:hypothetical protein
VSADSRVPKLSQDSHSADLHFARAMLEHPAASDCDSVKNRQRVKCVRVLGVHFYFLGHALLFDKNAAANREGALQVGRRFDRNYFDPRGFVHERLTSARWTKRQIHFELKPGLCYAAGG